MEKIRKRARIVLNALDCPEGELSILILDDLQIETLNEKYLKRKCPTNVIAFPMQEGKFSNINPRLLGDVVISLETARREAKDSGITTEMRFTQLLVHGILHLFGYDHETTLKESLRMEKKSDAILKRIEETGE